MECKNLMIGDWVYEGNDHPIQVVRNYGRSIMYKEEYSNEVEETCLNPIPLSEDILNVNGFDIVKDGDMTTLWRQGDDEYANELYDITIYHTKGTDEFDARIVCKGLINKYLNYVHELQNALRLCRLNDLADDFKVE